ncbi:hypothetical protein L2E82_11757 [Cichorium intybus]|uniref:Uncharacterized protein n=1 Tax=Cichorium intybus TaxID=13427 RepID=A0ACB9GDP1_CICIN|nr:hypothetical protein L2E82_11757 [Cichorium intybus]
MLHDQEDPNWTLLSQQRPEAKIRIYASPKAETSKRDIVVLDTDVESQITHDVQHSLEATSPLHTMTYSTSMKKKNNKYAVTGEEFKALD